MLYVSTSERKTVAQIFHKVEGIQRVDGLERCLSSRRKVGVIQFTLEDKQVHFEINLDAASRMALKISSRLLVLARIVKDQGRNADSSGKLAAAAPVTSANAFFPPSAQPGRGDEKPANQSSR